jgi:serine/threonine protein kinase
MRAYVGSAKEILREALPLTSKHAGVTCQWSAKYQHLEIRDIVDYLGASCEAKSNVLQLKKRSGRSIFCISVGMQKLVIKKFFLGGLKRFIGYKNYAYAEAANLILAKKRGLNVPNVIGLVDLQIDMQGPWCAVIMEFLPGRLMKDSISDPSISPREKKVLINRAIEPLKQMYLRGIHHIDYGPHAIILTQDTTEADSCIDFQYVGFYEAPVIENAIHQAAYFCWAVSGNREWISTESAEHWFEMVLAELEIQDTLENRAIFQRSIKRRQSTKHRLAGFSKKLQRL